MVSKKSQTLNLGKLVLMIDMKTQYDKRKSISFPNLLKNGWKLPEDLDEEVYNEIKQCTDYLNYKTVEEGFKKERLYLIHAVLVIGQKKFRSISYNTHYMHNFKIMQDTGLLSDFYTFNTKNNFDRYSYTQYDKNKKLESQYFTEGSYEYKVTDNDWNSLNHYNASIFNKEFYDAFINISNYIPEEDYQFLSFGLKDHGKIIEVSFASSFGSDFYSAVQSRQILYQQDRINKISKEIREDKNGYQC